MAKYLRKWSAIYTIEWPFYINCSLKRPEHFHKSPEMISFVHKIADGGLLFFNSVGVFPVILNLAIKLLKNDH